MSKWWVGLTGLTDKQTDVNVNVHPCAHSQPSFAGKEHPTAYLGAL